VFLREGYQASIDMIISEGGIARQTLYNHFKDKKALFNAVIEAVALETMRELRILEFTADVKLPEALRRFGEAYMQGMLHPENLAMTRLISSAVLEYPAVGKIAYQVGSERSIARLAAYLRAQKKAGAIRCSSPEMIAESFFGALVGPARFRYLLGINVESSPEQRRDYVREIVNLYVQGLSKSSINEAENVGNIKRG
jgi:TetR/AcrR family transcriptional regulator, mexJK operon transcriptional repressor